MVTVEELKATLPAICKQYQIAYVDVYGSTATNNQTENSDIDLVIEFEEPRDRNTSKRFFGFLHALEDHYHRKIDLLTEKSLKNPYFVREISKNRTRIYG